LHRRALFGPVLLGVLAIGLCSVAAAAPRTPLAAHRPGEILIKFDDAASPDERQRILSDLGSTRVKRFRRIRAEQSSISGLSVGEAIERYREHPLVEYIEPNYIVRSQEVPNDPAFHLLWSLNNFGQSGGTPDADISAPEAWNLFSGTSDVLVAIIDSGIDYTHDDLAANIFVNDSEIPGNGVDDDENGYIDDIRGWNFYFDINDPMDDNGHGTHVAGTVGAVGDNSIGIVGVNWRVKLLPLKFLSSDGFGATSDAIDAIDYAVLMGADIINASWGGTGPSQALFDSVRRAGDDGILFVAAAGNTNPGNNNDVFPFYPASLPLPNVISVAATDHDDQLWFASNYGADTVHLAAPGVNIYSTIPGNGYAFFSGTSMAAPHVAGAAALIKGRFPEVGAIQMKGLLTDRVDVLDSLVDRVASQGRLNALLPITDPDQVAPDAIGDLTTTDPDANRIDLEWTATGDDGPTGTATRYEVRFATWPMTEETFDLAAQASDAPDPRPAGSWERMRVSGLAPETTYWFAVRARDDFGNPSPISNIASGTTLGPPQLSVTPESVSATLFTGGVATRTLTLTNSGLGEYAYSIETERGTEAAAAVRPNWGAARGVALEGPSWPRSSEPYGPPVEPAPDRVEATGAPGSGLRLVFLQSGADVSLIRSLLIGFPDISVVDVLDARFVAPSLQQLRQYDVALVVTNTVFEDPVALGDVLADYVDEGGGVVLTLAAFIQGWELQGRLIDEGYSPFEVGVGPQGGASLGDFDRTHPIMEGVETASGTLLGAVSLSDNAQLVAQWDNTQPFVATKGLVVAVNIYLSGNGFWNGDVPLILRNAAFWSSNLITWLSAAPSSGVVPAGDSLDVTVAFDATGLAGGRYDGAVILRGNDPLQPRIDVPAQLEVTAAPDIQISADSLDFGAQLIGLVQELPLTLTNIGTEALNISGLSVDSSEFGVDTASLALGPSESTEVRVAFAPAAGGERQGALIVLSDDPDQPEVHVALRGVGLVPPRIEVQPDSFAEVLRSGESVTRTMTLFNSGGSALDFRVTVEDEDVPQAVAGATAIAPLQPPPPGPADVPSLDLVGQMGDLPLVRQSLSPFQFFENFEDGDLEGWTEAPNSTIKEVTDATAALGTHYSHHQSARATGHFNGIARAFGDQRPGYVGFHVRSGSTETSDAYFVLRDVRGCPSLGGCELIWFYAREGGELYVNGDVGGNASVPYQPDVWYHVEFKRIDFEQKQFDYHVDGKLIQADIPFRHADEVEYLHRLDMYSFHQGADAWWDEITLADDEPGQPVRVAPRNGRVLPGTAVQLTVSFDTLGLAAGEHRAELVVSSNDIERPEVIVPAVLNVLAAPDLFLPAGVPEFGSLFVGATRQRVLTVGNRGTAVLHVTNIVVDEADFGVGTTELVVEPGETEDVLLTFRPSRAGTIRAGLTLHSNDPDQPRVKVELNGSGVVAPQIEVAPQAFSETLFSGGTRTRTMTIENQGGSDLAYHLRVDVPIRPPDVPGPGAFFFFDDFEDGDLAGWLGTQSAGTHEVTDATAANGTRYSFHEAESVGGHQTGINLQLPDIRPGYIGFYVRPGAPDSADSYVVLTNPSGIECIFFFASTGGEFYLNEDVGGNTWVAYEPGTWYHVEFKQIDFDSGTFEYHVDNVLIQQGVPFRHRENVQAFSRLDLYNFSPDGEAWWDEITVAQQTPPEPVRLSSLNGVVAAGARAEIGVTFSALDLSGGSYLSTIVVESDDPLTPLVEVPAELQVTDAPDIELSDDFVNFGPSFLGVPVERVLTLSNRGSALLVVDGLGTDHADFVVEPDGFALFPGGSRDVLVRFRPSVVGPIEGHLLIASSDPDEGDVAVPLRGEGITPPEIDIAPATLNVELFSGQSAEPTLTVSNTGGTALVWEIAFPDNGEPPPWLAVSAVAGSLPPGHETVLTVALDAEGLNGGSYLGHILLRSNDPDEPELDFLVQLQVIAAPDIELSAQSLDFNAGFVGYSAHLPLTVTNSGAELLAISELRVDGSGFRVEQGPFELQPRDSLDIDVIFEPSEVGPGLGSLVLFSNDPDQGRLSVALSGEGRLAPDIEVRPASLTEQLFAGETSTHTLTVENLAAGELSFSIDVEPAVAGPDAVRIDDALLFGDDFEDGDFDDWSDAGGIGINEVTDFTAADGSRFSYHEFASAEGHVDGIYHELDQIRPSYISFWVRLPRVTQSAGYFVLRGRTGLDVIWFFATSNGTFYVNADVGGVNSFAYAPNRWYHIEFREIDFGSQSFDFYVDRQRRARNVPFRNRGIIGDLDRLDLYNYDESSEAWWDEIVFSREDPFTAVTVTPREGKVAPGQALDAVVTFDARHLIAGDYAADIVVRSDDPDEPVVVVPAELHVDGESDIGISRHELDFGTVQIGVTASRAVTVTNFGTDTLVVSELRIDEADYSANSAGFSLEPEKSRAVAVTFSPSRAGPVESRMILVSNDPRKPELEIELLGVGSVPARLRVAPGSLSETRFPGQAATRTLTVENTGGEPLDFELELDQLSVTAIPTETTIFFDDMEHGPMGWTTEVYGEEDLWHVSERRAHSPSSSWWCGVEDRGHYGTPYAISTAVISPSIDLRDAAAPVNLSFHENYVTETHWDQCMVDLSRDGGSSWIPLRGTYGFAPSGSSNGWVLEQLDLSAYAGEIVRLRFYFETTDPTNNALPGWYFDDVRVTANAPPWLSVSPDQGRLESGQSAELLVTFDALRFRPPGVYDGEIRFYSNDPLTPQVDVPATLVVETPPHIALPGPEVVLDSVRDAASRRTVHRLSLPRPPAGGGQVMLEVEGNYDATHKTATASAEGFMLGLAGGASAECGTAQASFVLAPVELETLAADGVVDLQVWDSAAVEDSCATQRHALRLSYPGALALLDFGEVYAGQTRDLPLAIANHGGGELVLDSIASPSPEISVSDVVLRVAPHDTATLRVSWSPRAAGALAATLALTSNDPRKPLVDLPLVGSALQPPAEARVEPASVEAALPPQSDRVQIKTVRLSNVGQAALTWSALPFELGGVDPVGGTVAPGASVDIDLRLSAAGRDAGDYVSALVLETNDPDRPRIEIPVTLHVRQIELEFFGLNFRPKQAAGMAEAALQLPWGNASRDVVLSTVSIHGLTAEPEPVQRADTNGDGIDELILYFDAGQLLETLPQGNVVEVMITGEVADRAWFRGSTFVRGVAEVDPGRMP